MKNNRFDALKISKEKILISRSDRKSHLKFQKKKKYKIINTTKRHYNYCSQFIYLLLISYF